MVMPPPSITFETPFGPCAVAWSDAGLTRVRILPVVTTNGDAAPPTAIRAAISALGAYFAGERVTFDDIALDTASVSAFHLQIYTALRRVAYGATTTYGALALAAGSDAGASRAVGVAMGRNPWPVIVPCHRVLASGGKLGGFSATGGTSTKQRLLVLEGAYAAAGTPDLFA